VRGGIIGSLEIFQCGTRETDKRKKDDRQEGSELIFLSKHDVERKVALR